MMTRAELLPELLHLARKVTGEEDMQFGEETPLHTIEEWDSLNHIHMVVGMENAFGIRFADAERLQGIAKIRDLLDLVIEIKGH